MAAHQALPSLGFSRQEHWSGLPFPSIMHESEKWKWSPVRLLVTPWTAAHQAPLSVGFSRQEYWSGVPLPSPCLRTRLKYICHFPLKVFNEFQYQSEGTCDKMKWIFKSPCPHFAMVSQSLVLTCSSACTHTYSRPLPVILWPPGPWRNYPEQAI